MPKRKRSKPKFTDLAGRAIDAGIGLRARFCNQPDHDTPRLKCGSPLPCHYHTVTIDVASQTINEPFTSRTTNKQRRLLREIGESFSKRERGRNA